MRLTPTIAGTAVSALALAGALAGALVGLPTTATADDAEERTKVRHPKRSVMVVGNNWAGTASVVDVRTKKKLATIDIVPDLDAELTEIATSPDRLALYLAVQQVVGEGNDQYVDDM